MEPTLRPFVLNFVLIFVVNFVRLDPCQFHYLFTHFGSYHHAVLFFRRALPWRISFASVAPCLPGFGFDAILSGEVRG